MKEKISRGIFWILSIGVILWGLILTFFVFFINRSMILQTLAIPIFGFIINPIILDKIIKKLFKTEVKYFSVIEFSLKFIGASLALIIAYAIFNFTQNEDIDNKVAWIHFESILKIVVFVIYLGILFVSKNANKVAKYITFGVIYFICVIFSFASLQVHYMIMYLLNIVSSSELDFATYEMLMNDVLIPIKEAILTYIIFDTIMSNENRKQDRIDDINIKKEREDKIIKDYAMTKFQLHSREHKRKKYTPYRFDEKKEYKIYHNIGKRYRKEFTGEKSKVNEKYPDFDKYSEWEKYFTKKFLLNNYNTCDFLHYLNEKLRFYQIFRECLKSLVIPIYVAILTIILTIYSTVPVHVEIKQLGYRFIGGHYSYYNCRYVLFISIW